MEILNDEIWVCADCLMAIVNDDYTGIDYYAESPARAVERENAIREGIAEWEKDGAYLVANSGGDCEGEDTGDQGESVFDRAPCECCGTSLAGARYRMALLGSGAASKAGEVG